MLGTGTDWWTGHRPRLFTGKANEKQENEREVLGSVLSVRSKQAGWRTRTRGVGNGLSLPGRCLQGQGRASWQTPQQARPQGWSAASMLSRGREGWCGCGKVTGEVQTASVERWLGTGEGEVWRRQWLSERRVGHWMVLSITDPFKRGLWLVHGEWAQV